MKAVAAAVVCGLLAMVGLVMSASLVVVPAGSTAVPYAPAFRGATSGPAALMNLHDGQAFGSLALDPLMSHADEWSLGRAHLAYRATRPLMSWLVGLTSFGSRSWAAWSVLAWTAVGIGLTAGAAAALSMRWGRSPDWMPLLLFLPGLAGLVRYGGLSDGLAAGLCLLGLARWLDAGGRGADRTAVVLFCLAGLCRESALVVPVALWLAAAGSGEARRRRLLLWPFAIYAGWVVVVALRLGVVPVDPSGGRLGLPFTGLVAGMRSWSWVGVLCALSVVAMMAVAWRRAPNAEVRWLVAVSVAFALVLGEGVWRSWDFARALLPATVVGACLVGPLLDRRPLRKLEDVAV